MTRSEALKKSAPRLLIFSQGMGKTEAAEKAVRGSFGLRCSFSKPIFIYIGYVQCQVVFAAAAVWLYFTVAWVNNRTPKLSSSYLAANSAQFRDI